MSKSKPPMYTWDNPQPSYTSRKGCFTKHAARSIKRGDMLHIKHPWRQDMVAFVLHNSVRACGELRVLAEGAGTRRPELDCYVIYPEQILLHLGNAFAPHRRLQAWDLPEGKDVNIDFTQVQETNFVNTITRAVTSLLPGQRSEVWIFEASRIEGYRRIKLKGCKREPGFLEGFFALKNRFPSCRVQYTRFGNLIIDYPVTESERFVITQR